MEKVTIDTNEISIGIVDMDLMEFLYKCMFITARLSVEGVAPVSIEME